MIPTIDTYELVQNQLPSQQRQPNWIALATAMSSPNDRLYRLFQMATTGSVDMGYWSATTVYQAGDLVRDLRGVFESVQDGNVGNDIGDTTYWRLVLESFIGYNERAKYTGQYLTLTYALNRHFGTTFRQPPYPSPYGGSGTFSDIYVTTDAVVRTTFVIYDNTTDSSKIYPTFSSGWVTVTPAYAVASSYRFTIHVPTATWTALGADDAIREAVVRSIADRYVPSGLTYSITDY
jgi:hypothetical protein